MHMVATLGAFRMKSEEVEVKLTIKHSRSGSLSESDTMDMETHSEVFDCDRVSNPLRAI